VDGKILCVYKKVIKARTTVIFGRETPGGDESILVLITKHTTFCTLFALCEFSAATQTLIRQQELKGKCPRTALVALQKYYGLRSIEMCERERKIDRELFTALWAFIRYGETCRTRKNKHFYLKKPLNDGAENLEIYTINQR